MVERLPEINEDEFGVKTLGRGKAAREERRRPIRKKRALEINNPPGSKIIFEEEHGIEHSEFRGKLGKKKGKGQRRITYLEVYNESRPKSLGRI